MFLESAQNISCVSFVARKSVCLSPLVWLEFMCGSIYGFKRTAASPRQPCHFLFGSNHWWSPKEIGVALHSELSVWALWVGWGILASHHSIKLPLSTSQHHNALLFPDIQSLNPYVLLHCTFLVALLGFELLGLLLILVSAEALKVHLVHLVCKNFH